MRYVKQHLTYPNVVSSIALFLVLSSGIAYATVKVGTQDLKSGAVTTKKLARNAVTTAKVAPGAVKAGKIAPDAIGPLQMAPGAVGPIELAAGAVGGEELKDGVVGAAQLAPNSVDGGKVVDGSISGSDLAPGLLPPAAPGVPGSMSLATVAMATGGPVKVATGSEQEEEEKEEEGEEGEEGEEPAASPIPLTPSEWSQGPEDNLIYLAQVEATLRPEEEAECGIEVEVSVDGQSLGTIPVVLPEQEEGEEEEGEEEGEEEEPLPAQTLTGGRILGPNLGSGAAQTRTLTASAMLGEDAVCQQARVDSLQILVLSIG
jgi:hypothetical protein